MSSRISVVYPVLMAALGTAVFAVPGLAAPLWAAIGAVTVAAILYGTRQHAPYSRAPWWLLAGAVAAMSAGDTLYAVGATGGEPAKTLANVCYLAMFPLVGTGLLGMSRSAAVLADRSRVLDLLTFTCAAVLACWVAVLGPTLTATELPTVDRSLLAAYVLGSLLVLVTTVRLAAAARSSWSVVTMVGGAAALLTGDVWYALATLGDGMRPGDPGEVPYLLFYVAWGVAPLHSSMARLTNPVPSWPSRLPVRNAVLLTVSLAVPSCLLFIESGTGEINDGVLIGAASLIMLLLVVIRLTDAIGQYRRSLVRERALREACGALLTALDVGQVNTAVRTAVGTLLPRGHPWEVMLYDANAGQLPRMSDDRRTRLIDTGLLAPATAASLSPHEATLICPLVVDGRPPGQGALMIAGSRLDLITTRNAIEVLAAQAALALERISLTETMSHRYSDEYLRAVVGNSTNLVMIIEPSGRLRYASPSLATMAGIDPTALPRLRDLVDPEDHARMARTLQRADADGVVDVWCLQRSDGRRASMEVHCRDLRGDRMVRGWVITLCDITERRRLEREQIRQALDASPAGQNRHSSATKYR